MTIEALIAEHKADMADKWADLIFGTYPVETQKIWKNKKNRFSNPVGAAIREATGELIDHLLQWEDADAICTSLDKMIRIRSVQDFSPSQALSFLFLFKKLLRDEYFEKLRKSEELEHLLRFEAKLDNMVLLAIDIYSRSREQIYRLRVEEVKRSQHTLLKKARMIVDVTADKAEE
ncbi:RsbRD N-terminal domain-containing protein [Salidesulfovibrio onnuriiensis]|uniref:RsbRD N-terminal domain-containing protein n=1 Tax=Salidesulfovibrio onnuriiensis TaxID=2583823 RepID=UPI0011CA31AD|nr:RsbRD N-terminal domain-containing protein [Salidesulfovibrio onnuriiensis]